MPRPSDFPRGELASRPAVEPIIQLMDDWFWAIEDGTANRRLPDVNLPRYPERQVNGFIRDIDQYISYQISSSPFYFTDQRGMDLPADFDRLQGASREAFMQSLKEAKRKYNEDRKD